MPYPRLSGIWTVPYAPADRSKIYAVVCCLGLYYPDAQIKTQALDRVKRKDVPMLGPLYDGVIGGHNLIVYAAGPPRAP